MFLSYVRTYACLKNILLMYVNTGKYKHIFEPVMKIKDYDMPVTRADMQKYLINNHSTLLPFMESHPKDFKSIATTEVVAFFPIHTLWCM